VTDSNESGDFLRDNPTGMTLPDNCVKEIALSVAGGINSIEHEQ